MEQLLLNIRFEVIVSLLQPLGHSNQKGILGDYMVVLQRWTTGMRVPVRLEFIGEYWEDVSAIILFE